MALATAPVPSVDRVPRCSDRPGRGYASPPPAAISTTTMAAATMTRIVIQEWGTSLLPWPGSDVTRCRRLTGLSALYIEPKNGLHSESVAPDLLARRARDAL